jgi:hypothetical protein
LLKENVIKEKRKLFNEVKNAEEGREEDEEKGMLLL